MSCHIEELEVQVKEYDKYRTCQKDAVDWLTKVRINIQQYGDTHGDQPSTNDKQNKLSEIAKSFNRGEFYMINASLKITFIRFLDAS